MGAPAEVQYRADRAHHRRGPVRFRSRGDRRTLQEGDTPDLRDLQSLLVLTRIPGIGPGRLRALVSRFRGADRIRTAPERELTRVEGIERRLAAQIVSFFRGSSASEAEQWAEDQLIRARKVSARILTIWDREYPRALQRIYDPPPLLFIQGSFEESDVRSIAVVGTRSPSSYGSRMAGLLAGRLAECGFTVVSGLARGIDTIAHAAALRAGGRTVAVIGSGLDVPYPPENRELAERIAGHGAVVSEYPMRTKPDAVNFPRRNRIVSGLALGTVVVETGIGGGAMITAAMALDQNREVFAVPGPVNDKCRSGTHLLIREGKAMLIESVDEILSELGANGNPAAAHPPAPPPAPLSLFEQRLLDTVGERPEHIDVLAARAGFPIADALVHLLSLEFKSAVRQHPGKYFSRS